MIAVLKRSMANKFKKFLLVLSIALIFEPLFLLFDFLCNFLRFGENSSLIEKLL
jgi:hypothetical protein